MHDQFNLFSNDVSCLCNVNNLLIGKQHLKKQFYFEKQIPSNCVYNTKYIGQFFRRLDIKMFEISQRYFHCSPITIHNFTRLFFKIKSPIFCLFVINW